MNNGISQAFQDFAAAEGRIQGAWNAAMKSPSGWDPSVVTELLSGLQRQAGGLVQLARGLEEIDAKLDAIKRKFQIP